MAENEIEISGEVGLPFTAKLSVRFKRRWTDRASKLIEDVDPFALRVLQQAYRSESGLRGKHDRPGSLIVFQRLQANVPAHPSVVLAAMARLAGLGFVHPLEGETVDVYRWGTTTWVYRAIALCQRHLDAWDNDERS